MNIAFTEGGKAVRCINQFNYTPARGSSGRAGMVSRRECTGHTLDVQTRVSF